MVDSPLRLELLATDPASAARRGVLHTPHGAVQLPAFMPVGTQATVKGCTIDMLRATGAEMVLGNTYHLALRPGRRRGRGAGRAAPFHGLGRPDPDRQRRVPGLQPGTALPRDGRSGRVPLAYRRAADRRCRPSGRWRSRRRWAATWPWCWITWWRCPATRRPSRTRVERTVALGRALPRRRPAARLRRCSPSSRAGWIPDLRRWCAEQLVELDFPGYAVGGLSVGETPDEMYRILDVTCPLLPARPAALPDGRGPAGGSPGGDPPRHRPVRLRDAHAQRPQRPGVYRRGPAAAAEPGASARSAAAWSRTAPAWPAATAGGICATCSWPARCWARCC